MALNRITYDIIVVGGGHAGVEAASAAGRMSARVLLVTQNLDTIGQMSCNPAIGGLGKSHLVREIDAMGGLMAQAADDAGIHFRILNSTKGPAVRATRAQSDRDLYKLAIKQKLAAYDNVQLFQQTVEDLIVRRGRVHGVVTGGGQEIYAPAVILTTGTFLGGMIYQGEQRQAAGRAGDAPANALASRLRRLPFRVGRLKTGTPPRLDKRTIDFSVMEEQPGDSPRPTMSFDATPARHPQQVCCHITATNKRSHRIVTANKHRSPIFGDKVQGKGPRYCPSIEDKVARFAGRDNHRIFVEPEGLHSAEVYPNGISTSLPYEVQQRFIRSIAGFEKAHITRPGYAIEYDYFDPRDLSMSLQTEAVKGLFFAGQINGTTGYEEAAAQGLVAGINAVLCSQGKEPWLPARDTSYMGVMLDDLTTRGAPEPYRLFTSRAEYRLSLREDNADARLRPAAHNLGLLDAQTWERFGKKEARVNGELSFLRQKILKPTEAKAVGLHAMLAAPPDTAVRLADLLRRPEVRYAHIAALLPNGGSGVQIAARVEAEIKYDGYINRQATEIRRVRARDEMPIPANFDFASVKGLSGESLEKLCSVSPPTLGAAGRIPGLTPAAVGILSIYLHKAKVRQSSGIVLRETQAGH